MSSTDFATALAVLKLPKQTTKQVKFIDLANAMNYKPKKMMKGKETKTLLKEGSTKYKEAVEAEIMRRYNDKKSKVPIVKRRGKSKASK